MMALVLWRHFDQLSRIPQRHLAAVELHRKIHSWLVLHQVVIRTYIVPSLPWWYIRFFWARRSRVRTLNQICALFAGRGRAWCD